MVQAEGRERLNMVNAAEGQTGQPRYLDLRAEFAFRALFGRRDHERITAAFLNALLGTRHSEPEGYSEIVRVAFIHQEPAPAAWMTGSVPWLEVMAETAEGSFIHIELQLLFESEQAASLLHQWSMGCTKRLIRGQLGSPLKRTCSILLSVADLFPASSCYHHVYGFLDHSKSRRHAGSAEIRVIELTKLQDQAIAGSLERGLQSECRWLLLFGVVQGGAVQVELLQQLRDHAAMSGDELLDALERWEEASLDPQLWRKYGQWHQNMMGNALYRAEAERVNRARVKEEHVEARSKAHGEAYGEAHGEAVEQNLPPHEQKDAGDRERYRLENRLLKERLLASGHRLLASGVLLEEVVRLTGIAPEQLRTAR